MHMKINLKFPGYLNLHLKTAEGITYARYSHTFERRGDTKMDGWSTKTKLNWQYPLERRFAVAMKYRCKTLKKIRSYFINLQFNIFNVL